MNVVPAVAAAARIRSQASSVGAIGFSSSTCRPGGERLERDGSCRWWGTITSTAVKPPAATASASDPNGAAPGLLGHRLRARRVGIDHRGDVDARVAVLDRVEVPLRDRAAPDERQLQRIRCTHGSASTSKRSQYAAKRSRTVGLAQAEVGEACTRARRARPSGARPGAPHAGLGCRAQRLAEVGVDPTDGPDRVRRQLAVVQVVEPVVAHPVAVLDEPVHHRAEHVDPHRPVVAVEVGGRERVRAGP